VVHNEAEMAGWTITEGPAARGRWELVQKAIFEDDDERIVHSTKRMVVKGGYLFEVGTTRYRKQSQVGTGDRVIVTSSYSHSKALTFAPDPNV